MRQQIKAYIDRYVKFEEEEIDVFLEHVTLKTFKKKEYLLSTEQVCKENFFILEGLVRTFYVNAKGEEKINQFGIENWWVTNTESFFQESPSMLYIQALENTKVLSLTKEHLERLYMEVPKTERLFRKITENMLVAIQRRNEYYMNMESKDRYVDLVNSFPSFIQRVPQYMIASYLEMTPEYLSYLRANFNS